MNAASPSGPLAGKTILVTRAQQQAGKLSVALRELGASVIELPVIEIVPPDSFEPLDNALRQLGEYDWLILTSANAVNVLAEHSKSLGVKISAFNNLKTVAIGSATASALAEQGINIDLVPDRYVAESVVDALESRVRGSRILLARARIARDVIPEALTNAGAQVDVVDAYQTVVPAGSEQKVHEIFSAARYAIDAVTFTSSSTVKNFVTLLKQAEVAIPLPGVKACSIGPVTSETLREYGWEPTIEADPYDIPGLIAATVKALTS
jgi:uroporphyrinogen-III synthase